MSDPRVVIAHPTRHREPVVLALDDVAPTVAAWFDPPAPLAEPGEVARFARVALVCADLQAACRPGARPDALALPRRALRISLCLCAPPSFADDEDPWSAPQPSPAQALTWVTERIAVHRAALAREQVRPRPRPTSQHPGRPPARAVPGSPPPHTF